VARRAGRPGAARAVGNILRGCGADVPAHRVVGAAGRLGGYAGQEHVKRALLMAEGIQVVGKRIDRFDELRWKR
jgi:alkylated DNA nucleotide flippase Atl1